MQNGDSHEPYTGGHCERVGEYSKILAEVNGFSEGQKTIAWRAGLMHDLAKVGIDAEVLSRPAKLSAVLMASIYAHPVEGYKILRDVKVYPEVALAVLEHHKRIDGSGYPEFHNDLTSEISPIGQIIGLADSFDAMTTPRPYLGGFGKYSLNKALRELQNDVIKGKYNSVLVQCLETAIPRIWEIFYSHIKQGKLSLDLYERNLKEPPPGVTICSL